MARITQESIFKETATDLVDTAVNALEEALTYLRDLPDTADLDVAVDLTQEALDHARGAAMALR